MEAPQKIVLPGEVHPVRNPSCCDPNFERGIISNGVNVFLLLCAWQRPLPASQAQRFSIIDKLSVKEITSAFGAHLNPKVLVVFLSHFDKIWRAEETS